VQHSDPDRMKRDSNPWTWYKCIICSWMMSTINRDMIRAAQDEPARENLEMLLNSCQHGGDPEHTDENGNTALHLAVNRCAEGTECLQRAYKLGLQNLDPHDMQSRSLLELQRNTAVKPKTAEARRQIKADIRDWKNDIDADLESVMILLDWGLADPLAKNKLGQTPVDLAQTKAPSILKYLDARIWKNRYEEEIDSIEDRDEKKAAKKAFKKEEEAARGLENLGFYF